jgi:tRNA modification GTPase
VNLDDTIVAISTPSGRGGIGVVRLAGAEARAIAGPMLRLKHDLTPGRAVFGELIDALDQTGRLQNFEAGTAKSRLEAQGVTMQIGTSQRSADQDHYAVAGGRVASPAVGESKVQFAVRKSESIGEDSERIDEVMVTFFEKPHSYTTDDIVEISAHGSPVVLRHIVEMALARGARLAEPGEFTMRAFLNGRLDLAQAEAVRDLIESQTLYQAKVAAQQLEGEVSQRLQPLKQKLLELVALLEAGIDFAEDDVSVLPNDEVERRITAVREPLKQLAESFAYGKLVHEGLTLAIVGRPNVGKSSLFNRLVERERAIVTASPGTTRDLVTETVALGGIPVELVDTAGIRRAVDEAESIGIRKSLEAVADADIVLMVVDASEARAAEDEELLKQVSQRHTILVENKSDLAMREFPTPAFQLPVVRTSAITGDGIPELRAQILKHLGGDRGVEMEGGFLTNARHRALVDHALAALDAASRAVENKVPHEMLLLDLYTALGRLDEITGATTTDDILNLIFSSFCIGK